LFGRLVVAVVLILAVVLVVADRVGAVVAAHAMAGRIETDAGLTSRPSVSIGGVPFLTQAVRGTYSDIRVSATDVPVSGVNLTSLKAHLHGVHVSLTDVAHDSVSTVPVDRVDGQAYLSFAAANAFLADRGLGAHLESGGHNTVRIVDTLTVGGVSVTVSGTATASVSGNILEVTVTTLRGPLGLELHRDITVPLPLRDLPFRLQLSSVAIGTSGMTATASAHDVVLTGS